MKIITVTPELQRLLSRVSEIEVEDDLFPILDVEIVSTHPPDDQNDDPKTVLKISKVCCC